MHRGKLLTAQGEVFSVFFSESKVKALVLILCFGWETPWFAMKVERKLCLCSSKHPHGAPATPFKYATLCNECFAHL